MKNGKKTIISPCLWSLSARRKASGPERMVLWVSPWKHIFNALKWSSNGVQWSSNGAQMELKWSPMEYAIGFSLFFDGSPSLFCWVPLAPFIIRWVCSCFLMDPPSYFYWVSSCFFNASPVLFYWFLLCFLLGPPCFFNAPPAFISNIPKITQASRQLDKLPTPRQHPNA